MHPLICLGLMKDSFVIPMNGLTPGRTEFRRKVGKEFFESFDNTEILDSDVDVLITVEKSNRYIGVDVDLKGHVTVSCDRCLEDVQVPLELDFDERVQTGGDESPAAAESVPEDAAEEGSAFEPDYYLQGYYLDVDKLLFGEALLNWPSRVLCKEDCKGLCPVCGQNLNHGDCGCVRKALDPQMSKVLDIFSKFKEV